MAKYKRYDLSQSMLIPVFFEEQLMPGTMEFAIHIIESSDYESQHIRDLTKKLTHSVKLVEPADLDEGRSPIDIVILGLSAGEDIEPAKQRLARIRSLSPAAQIVLCLPPDTESLDSIIMSFGARSFLLKPIEDIRTLDLLV